jgi:hypothetical protein
MAFTSLVFVFFVLFEHRLVAEVFGFSCFHGVLFGEWWPRIPGIMTALCSCALQAP